MNLKVDELKAACYAVARATLLEQKPIDASLLERHADLLFTFASNYRDFFSAEGRDPNLVTRAVLYLAEVHAMPAMQDDATWFIHMLMALLELACPNIVASRAQESFYKDVEEGIAISRSSYPRS